MAACLAEARKFQVPHANEQPCLERAGRGASAGFIGWAESTGRTRGYIPAPLTGLMSYHLPSANHCPAFILLPFSGVNRRLVCSRL